MKLLKVALIGSGKMGKKHLEAIRNISQAKITAIVDPYIDQETIQNMHCHNIKFYQSAEALFQKSKPDIVHIVTPPATHFQIAKKALENSIHVLVEKPFTQTSKEAEELVKLAQGRQLILYAGHQLLFQKAVRLSDELIEMIGALVYLESYFSFRMVRKSISAADQIIDILPHPVYTLLHYMTKNLKFDHTEQPQIKHIEVRPKGELRASISAGDISGNLIITLKGRPVDSYLKIVGTNGMLILDFVRGIVLKHIGPGQDAISAVLFPYSNAWQTFSLSTKSFFGLAFGKNKNYPGLFELFGSFYNDIRKGTQSALSTDSILATVSVCEEIGKYLKAEEEIYEKRAEQDLLNREKPSPLVSDKSELVLVTGGTGFLGTAIVRELRKEGYAVRVLSRNLPLISDRLPGVEYVSADLGGELEDSLFKKVNTIVHCAAETSGGKNDHQRNSIDATRNLFLKSAEKGIDKFIHISSIAVLKSNLKARRTGLNENSEIDADNIGRGPYVWGKAQSEIILNKLSEEKGKMVKILRPGPLVDYANFEAPGRLGRQVGSKFIVLGSKKSRLSVCDVNEAAKIIVHYVNNYRDSPPALNLVSPSTPTRQELISRLAEIRIGFKSIFISDLVVSLISFALKIVQKIIAPTKKPVDVKAAFSSEKYDTALVEKIAKDAGIIN